MPRLPVQAPRSGMASMSPMGVIRLRAGLISTDLACTYAERTPGGKDRPHAGVVIRVVATVIFGSRTAQPERLTAHLDRLYRAAWALCGSPHDAEDLVQETYARVLSRPRLLLRHDELPYLMKALRNTYLTGLRTASRRPRTVAVPGDDLTVFASSDPAPDVAVE